MGKNLNRETNVWSIVSHLHTHIVALQALLQSSVYLLNISFHFLLVEYIISIESDIINPLFLVGSVN